MNELTFEEFLKGIRIKPGVGPREERRTYKTLEEIQDLERLKKKFGPMK